MSRHCAEAQERWLYTNKQLWDDGLLSASANRTLLDCLTCVFSRLGHTIREMQVSGVSWGVRCHPERDLSRSAATLHQAGALLRVACHSLVVPAYYDQGTGSLLTSVSWLGYSSTSNTTA